MTDKRATWILVGDSSRARIFSPGREGKPWRLIEEFDYPKGRARTHDLVTDKRGLVRQIGSPGMVGGMEPQTDPKDVEAQRFAGILADELAKGESGNLFAKLVLVAPPHFLGHLRKTLLGRVLDRVATTVDRDYTNFPEQKLRKLLAEPLAEAG